MKNVLAKLALISFALMSGACNKVESSNNESSISDKSSILPISMVTSNASQNSSANDYVEDQLSNSSGLVVKFNKTGAKIDSINFAGKKIAENGFTVGRCANRIAAGKFTLNGQEYQLTKNNNGNHLHGGNGKGMSSWQGPFATNDWTKVGQTATTIEYTFHSADGDNGYPGNMDMNVKYTLTEAGELKIEYHATCDKDSLCNPTNHLFMTLNGNTSYDNIKLWVNADNYTPLSNQLPTGDISPVEGTQFDYREEKAFDFSKSYDDNYVSYDHNYVIKGEKDSFRKCASMTGTSLGVKVDVYSDRAGLQLYKENNGKICLETQQFPDAINHENFLEYGTTIIRANVPFESKTTYHFQKVA